MSAHLGHLLAGLGGGAVIGALALGLVLTHRASGVVNFAHGAVGLYAASAFFELRESGDLVLPLLGLPSRLHLVERPTVFTAAVVTALFTSACGVVLYAGAIRPLRHAAALPKVAATLGVFLYLQEMARLRFPPSSAGSRLRRAVLPDGSVSLLGTATTQGRLLLAVGVVGVAVLLWGLLRHTRWGLAARAASDSEQGARLVGLSPSRLAACSWALAAVLAGAAMVAAEPMTGLGPASSLLVVPALGAALVARFRSLPVAALGGVGIGMVQSLILGHAVGPSGGWIPDWLPTTGLQELVPTVLIVGLLVWRGGLPEARRGAHVRLTPTPVPTRNPAWSALPVLLAIAALLGVGATLRQALIVSIVFAVLCLSIVVVTGYSGQLSLAQLAIAGIAGFATLRLAHRGVPFALAAPLAVLLAMVVGAIVAVPTTRLRGASFAAATLAVAVTIERLVLHGPALPGPGTQVPRPSLFGLDLGISAPGTANYRAAFGLMALAVLVLACLVVAALRRSSIGLRWSAVQADERAAAAVGIDAARTKVGAFAVGAAIAGAAGVLMAYATPALSSQSFMAIGSVVALALTTLAGVSRIAGALVAGALAQSGLVTTLLGQWTGGSSAEHVLALSGLALVVTVVLAPEGLVSSWSSAVATLRARVVRARASAAPSVHALTLDAAGKDLGT